MNAPNAIEEYKYKGRDIGVMLAFGLNNININSEYYESFDIIMNMEKEFRESTEGKIIIESFLSGQTYTDHEKLNYYLEGLRKGIEDGLKKKGLRSDNQHLKVLKKNQNMRNTFTCISDFLKNKENERSFTDKKIFSSTINLIFRMVRIRDKGYQINIINNIIDKIINDNTIQSKIIEILDKEYGDYIDRWYWNKSGTIEIPDTHLFKSDNNLSKNKIGGYNESKGKHS